MVVVALEGAAVLTARSTARASRKIVWPLLLALVAATLVLSAVPTRTMQLAAGTLDSLVLVSLTTIIVVRFRRSLYVTAQSVLGAVTVYLVLGLLYAVLDPTLTTLAGQRFFAQSGEASFSQYTYYSFITLCTVGYGDLTPISGLARALAVSEALVGQLYLVTVIALVVANVGRQRQRPRQFDDSGTTAPAP